MIVTINRAGHSIQADVSRLSEDIKARLMVHGLIQKVGDAAAPASKAGPAAGMTPEAWAGAQMMKVLDALYAGDWGRERSGGVTQSREERVRESLIRKALRKDEKAWKAFKIQTEEKQAETIDLFYAANRAKIDRAVSAMMAIESDLSDL
jgi:hypothetical protein